MGLKKQFVEKVKEHFPAFTEEGSVEIEFAGGGDSFDSFHSISVWGEDWKPIEGDWNFSGEDEDFFFELLSESGVNYDWNNAGTTGRINYEDGQLSVETTVSYDHWGQIEDEEESKN